MTSGLYEKRELFDRMLERVTDTGRDHALDEPQAFARWFVEMTLQRPSDIFASDGAKDGKVDLFCITHDDQVVRHHIVNSKFTRKYNEIAPVRFYDEITRFWQAFENRGKRKAFLQNVVRPELRARYRTLLDRYDAGAADLIFVTNHRRNEAQNAAAPGQVHIIHLEDLVQFMVDHIEEAMPKTPDMLLTGINSVLSPDERDTEVPTSIVFARLIDFMTYMKKDPYDLLFARNVRLSLGDTPVNNEIRDTFERNPKEFVFSNNGLTMLCEKHRHDPGSRELTITNPRIVNGSQTLHSIRDVPNPSVNARIMVRVIEVSALNPNELAAQAVKRRDVIQKISTRTNRQNPIKKWNLVAHDEFQNELARYFRKQMLFYERRDKEWSYRRTELKAVGIRRGPKITSLAQRVSSYFWANPDLGPVTAKRTVNGLFEEKLYEQIRAITPMLAHQIFVLSEAIDRAFASIWKKDNAIRALKGHGDQALFAVVVRSLQHAGLQFGTPASAVLVTSNANWTPLVNASANLISSEYTSRANAYKKQSGKDLTYNNYFKSPAYVDPMLKAQLPKAITDQAIVLVRGAASPRRKIRRVSKASSAAT